MVYRLGKSPYLLFRKLGRTLAVLEWDRAKRRRPNQKPRKVNKPRSTKCEALQDDSSDEISSVDEAGESLFRSKEEL